MGFNQKEYIKGRSQGLLLANILARSRGIEALKKDISFREKTGIDSDANTFAIDVGLVEMKEVFFESMECMCLNILRDEFDFGKVRAKRFLDEWRKVKNEYQELGINDWYLRTEEIKRRLHLDVLQYIRKPKPRRTDYDEGRLNGMKMFVDLYEKKDVDTLNKMLDQRVKIPKFSKNDVVKKYNETIKIEKKNRKIMPIIEEMCSETVLSLIVSTLNKVFGFGESRCMRFTARWDLKNECLHSNYVTWDDLKGVIRDELDLDVSYPMMINEGLLKAC